MNTPEPAGRVTPDRAAEATPKRRSNAAGKAPSERNPVARLTETLGRLPRYLALARALAADPAIPRWRKAALAASIVYLASPIDLVPGLIPVAGQLDDLAAVLLGLRVALQGASPAGRAAHLEKAGLSDGAIARDLAIVRGAAGWIARRAAGTTVRVGKASAKVSVKALGTAGRLGLKAGRAGLEAARRLARPKDDAG
jgi:uncharacterized membrane protein YkvA (DUF1232 family)